MLCKKLNLFTSQIHEEMTPVKKRLHLEHAGAFKLILNNIMSAFLEMIHLEM